MPKARTIILVIAVIFVIYAVINSPEDSAEVVRSAFDTLVDAVRGIGRFFDSLLTG